MWFPEIFMNITIIESNDEYEVFVWLLNSSFVLKSAI